MKYSSLIAQCIIAAFCSVKAYLILFSMTDLNANLFVLISFLLWLSPLIVFLIRNGLTSWANSSFNPTLAIVGLISTIIGSVIELNALKNLGFSFALASLLPLCSLQHLIWTAGSLLWMPLFTFFCSKIFPNYVELLRVLLTIVIVIPILQKVIASRSSTEVSSE